ncbi:protein kibra-like isoform X3 [Tachypleus tridentatus]|uniref:protein kibra-like isoform X3 n=1 Tax=Tachypleus tridentatus TaxID=6853 RepID=UPI003FCFE91E
MSKSYNGNIPLPNGWDIACDFDGKIYFIDHINKETTWLDPRDRLVRPNTFADCVGDELPYGWEQCYDSKVGYYYVNHVTQTNQIEDPRQQYRQLQEHMLKDYLLTAQEDLLAKQEIFDIKQQRLLHAQDEYQHLREALQCLSTCTSSSSLCSMSSLSSGSSGRKYDTELLKAEVAQAHERVAKLKQELSQIRTVLHYKEQGLETLSEVDQQFTDHPTGYSLEQAQAIMEELKNIQMSLSSGKKEKAELMQCLSKLKDELTRLQPSSSDIMSLSIPSEKLNTASQTDLSGEVAHLGARLAEMARLRFQYDEKRKHIQRIQQDIADLEDKMTPGQLESDKDRLLLIQEKEQLLQELRSTNIIGWNEFAVASIQEHICKLQEDICNAKEIAHKTIADRLKLHEKKNFFIQELSNAIQQITFLETKLKNLSASTLSMSSSSSLGSLSTSSLSASSLSFTDIYGLPKCSVDPSVQCHVGQLMQGSSQSIATSTGAFEAFSSSPALGQGNSGPSLSTRSSLSSISPPMSPYELHPSCDHASALAERQQRLKILESQLSELKLEPSSIESLKPSTSQLRSHQIPEDSMRKNHNWSYYSVPQQNVEGASKNTISYPVYEPEKGSFNIQCSEPSSRASVSAAVSEESVAGDSGVFEASVKRLQVDRHIKEDNIETAQVRLKLRYALEDHLLHVGIEQARNLSELNIQENHKICVKAALLPFSSDMPTVCSTRLYNNFQKPTFGESFKFFLPLSKLFSKTLQVYLWSVSLHGEEECLGSAQVSLADFNPDQTLAKWYNILSFRFMRSEPLSERSNQSYAKDVDERTDISEPIHSRILSLKEESSDESTIISSQTSTLTRNQDPELVHFGAVGEEQDEESEDDEDEEKDQEDENFQTLSGSEVNFSEMVREAELLGQETETCDKETNTECVFPPVHRTRVEIEGSSRKSEIKRSQTFTPCEAVNKYHYICRLNRSDSDSSVPLYKKEGNFLRNSAERKSLRWRKPPGKCVKHRGTSFSSTNPKNVNFRTSLDLALDLRACQTRLTVLHDEISKLKEVKYKLEDAKTKGDMQLLTWINENENIQQLFASGTKEAGKQIREEKKVEKLLRRTAREIYKFRKNRNKQMDISSFKEKMAFFTRADISVPQLPPDDSIETEVSKVQRVDLSSKFSPVVNSTVIGNKQGDNKSTSKNFEVRKPRILLLVFILEWI